MTLLQNGTAYETKMLSEANGWQYTWENLPRYDKSGREITWTIRESAVSGYVSCSYRLCIPDYRNFFQKEKR